MTARSENSVINKCYHALVSHIFFSHIKWGSTPDDKCCVRAGNCKAWPGSGDTLLHKSLNKEQMSRDFLTNSVNINSRYTGLLSDISVFLIVACFSHFS